MPGKQLFEINGLHDHNFPSSFKRRKFDAIRSFPVNCGTPAQVTILCDMTHLIPNAKCNSRSTCDANACDNSLSNIKNRKVDVTRYFPKHCGPFATGSHGGESERPSGDATHPSYADVSKCELAIPAVPLRTVPPTNVESNPEKSLALHGKDDVGIEMAKNENKVCKQEEFSNCDLGNVTKLITRAEELVTEFGATCHTFKEVPSLEDFLPESKGVHELPSSDVLHKQTSIRELPPLEVVKQEKGLIEENMVESRGKEIVDLADSCSLRTESDQPSGSEGLSDCELTGTKRVKKLEEHSSLDVDECAPSGTKEQAELLEKFNINYHQAIVVHSDLSNSMINNNDGLLYSENQKQLINPSMQHEQPQGYKVLQALKKFEEQYTEVLQENKAENKTGKRIKYPHFEAADRVKAVGMWIYPERPFGHIPGIEIGHEFRFRTELAIIGLHRHLVSGIDYVVLDGKKFATSVVNSGRYENNTKGHDVLIYCGQGGNQKNAEKAVDQKLEKGNVALLNSMEMRYPVRVTHKRKRLVASKGTDNVGNFVYVYDGLYIVNKFWDERDKNDKLVFKFELHRMTSQPRPRQSIMRMETCVVDDDVSQGKENKLIRAMNGVDDDRPRPFIYVTHIFYPHWFQLIDPTGCDCVNGCSDSQQCPCVLKNGGEIPFNEKGSIVRARPIVHECGPSCKCPPSCMNRVSQHGPRHQLEIFKTKSRGWGLRSQSCISSGSFICEYVGELLREKEAEQRIGNDEYLFDICDDGFVIDAAMMGNVGRFINHSCSPNLYAQEVLYDHDDKRMPHIMFFATKNIPPLQELTYDYNYKMGQICDVNGNIKTKDCHCGSRKCTGRMY
ncbi:histone H3 (Lys9) methyltransferase SUV39H1/Clr4, required for transcriptional silencing [Handroanthus impetiginosus]|uniref:Histone H3 (Lys9) methyltransferase SUV39H1/Clr4, required for transcriptional silencing n=1 Tax=Handroanthus impetiginosus TaxID=429701 RepID=A0A2G9H2X7_9LAMI|nr:histone H3 (Lys9) methyltransferase SUV39H1/Clr4, required for transcriptional silencing [Handroanthus impetiginosus]